MPKQTPQPPVPSVQFEEYDRLSTDSARHTTYWVENSPRTEMGAGFLHGIMFTPGVRRSLSLIYVPQGLECPALRDVQRKKSAIISDANERARRGQVNSEVDSVEYADVKTRERQLIAGHADVALTGLVTVTAETDALLNAACAQIETAAITAGVDLRRLNYQQPDAFTLAALPLARTEARRNAVVRRLNRPTRKAPLIHTPSAHDDAHPYLRAATAGVRHHTRALTPSETKPRKPADRPNLDVLHAHLAALLQLLDRLADSTRPPHPAAGRHLATAHTRLWQATSEVHAAFHLLPSTTVAEAEASVCQPDRPRRGHPY
ncbi:hypothetical protein SMICM17S_13086 [Streptomyces microflavus]